MRGCSCWRAWACWPARWLRRLSARLYSLARQIIVTRNARRRAAGFERTVDLQVFQHALYVIARLGEWHMLDPVHRVFGVIARRAELPDPAAHIARAGIVGGDRHHQRAVIAVDQPLEVGASQRQVV